MRKGSWPKIEPVEQVKRAILPLFAFVGRGDPVDDSLDRPTRFRARDADGNVSEVFAPRGGHITRWP